MLEADTETRPEDPEGPFRNVDPHTTRVKRRLPASRYIFAVQRTSYSICSAPKALEQSLLVVCAPSELQTHTHIRKQMFVRVTGSCIHVLCSISFVQCVYNIGRD